MNNNSMSSHISFFRRLRLHENKSFLRICSYLGNLQRNLERNHFACSCTELEGFMFFLLNHERRNFALQIFSRSRLGVQASASFGERGLQQRARSRFRALRRPALDARS